MLFCLLLRFIVKGIHAASFLNRFVQIVKIGLSLCVLLLKISLCQTKIDYSFLDLPIQIAKQLAQPLLQIIKS